MSRVRRADARRRSPRDWEGANEQAMIARAVQLAADI
jgi:hypothetical protein